jgi:hypothetical protein
MWFDEEKAIEAFRTGCGHLGIMVRSVDAGAGSAR